jgi:hypothetical protein
MYKIVQNAILYADRGAYRAALCWPRCWYALRCWPALLQQLALPRDLDTARVWRAFPAAAASARFAS